MKKLKKLFQLLPVFAIAFVSGLSAILSNKRDISPLYAEDLTIFTYDDTQDFTYSSGTSTSVRIVTDGYSRIVQDSVTHQYQLSYGFRIKNIYISYNNITIQALPNDNGVLAGNEFYSGYLDDDGSLPPYQDRDFTLTLTKVTTYNQTPDIQYTQGSPVKTIRWRGVVFTFTYSIAGFTGSSLNELPMYNFTSGSNNYIRFDVSSSIDNGDLSHMYLRSYGNINKTLVDIDYPDNLSAYEQGYLAGSRDGYDIGYTDGQQTGYNGGRADGYAFGYEDGYNEGYSEGIGIATQTYDEGYADGYNDGFSADTTATTIFSGILQVGMLPINVFLAIFNFEILGINLSAFISAILTVCLTIIVIRTIKGGSE